MKNKFVCLLSLLVAVCVSGVLFADFPLNGVGDAPADNGWQEQPIFKHNGCDYATVLNAKMRILSENWNAVASVPSVVYMPEKNRLLLMITGCGYPHRSMMMESDDLGETWTKPHFINNTKGEADVSGIGMCYLGDGHLMMYRGYNRAVSDDYGLTWDMLNTLDPAPGEPAWDMWDPPLFVRDGNETVLYETGYHAKVLSNGGYHSQAYIRTSTDKGKTWSEPIKVPQWDHVNEVYLAQAPNGDLVAACRTDNRSWWLDHISGLQTCVSTDRGQTWSEPFVVFESGPHHPSVVSLADGRMVMTYVVRNGYPDDADGNPRFGVEAVVSNDNGKTWDIDGRYILASFTGETKGENAFICATQASSSVVLPDGKILTTFGTGHRSHLHHETESLNSVHGHGYRDVGVVVWEVVPQSAETPRQKATLTARKFQIDQPFWDFDSRMVYGESLLFIQDEGKSPVSQTLFVPGEYRRIVSSDRKTTYFENVDYTVQPDKQTIELTPDSKIPFFKRSDLFPPTGSDHCVPHRASNPNESILFYNDAYFHNHQALIDYVPVARDTRTPGAVESHANAPDHWKGFVPKFAGSLLPKTMAKLKAKKPITLCVSGDSISQGYNVSSFSTLRVEPFQPSYSELVAIGLEACYGSPITLKNFAISGWNSSAGVTDLPQVLDANPDLLIIAYGMNDIGLKDPETYRNNLKTIIDTVRKKHPNCEFVLVSTMLGNFEWVHTPESYFPIYRDAVASLQKEYPTGVAFADMTTMWTDLLKRKTFYDLVGNGVNHPNDFGHRIYAQVILGLLVE